MNFESAFHHTEWMPRPTVTLLSGRTAQPRKICISTNDHTHQSGPCCRASHSPLHPPTYSATTTTSTANLRPPENHAYFELPSPFGVLSTPPPPQPPPPAAGGARAFAARFSFFKRGLGVWPASSSLPRSSLRLLCAPPALPAVPDPEEPAEPPLKALEPSGNEWLLLLPPPLPPPPLPPPRADDPVEPAAAVEAAAAAAWASKTAGSLQNLRVLVPVVASILA